MPDRPTKTDKGTPSGASRGTTAGMPQTPSHQTKPEAAFNLWLERGLHKLFDDIAQEPIPEALLKIIEQDRNKR